MPPAISSEFRPLIVPKSPISMPFVVPLPISNFFTGGIGLVAIVLAAILLVGLLFIPFVKMADKEALAEEAAAKASAE